MVKIRKSKYYLRLILILCLVVANDLTGQDINKSKWFLVTNDRLILLDTMGNDLNTWTYKIIKGKIQIEDSSTLKVEIHRLEDSNSFHLQKDGDSSVFTIKPIGLNLLNVSIGDIHVYLFRQESLFELSNLKPIVKITEPDYRAFKFRLCQYSCSLRNDNRYLLYLEAFYAPSILYELGYNPIGYDEDIYSLKKRFNNVSGIEDGCECLD